MSSTGTCICVIVMRLRQRDHEGVRERRVRDAHMRERLVDRAQRGQPHEARRPPSSWRISGLQNSRMTRVIGQRSPATLADAGGAELPAVGVVRASRPAGSGAGTTGAPGRCRPRRPAASCSCHRPLNAKLWLAGRGKQSKAGSAGGVPPSGPSHAKTTPDCSRAPGSCAGARAVHSVEPAGFGRGLEAGAVDGELPAVEGAAQAVGFMAAEGQVGAAVRAVAVEQAEARRCRRGTAPGPGRAGAPPSPGAAPCAGSSGGSNSSSSAAGCQ